MSGFGDQGLREGAANRVAGRALRLQRRLSERDLAILGSLAKLRLLNGDQVLRLHVADGSELTRARRTRSVLERLTELGAVVRLGRSIGGLRGGSAGFVYGLSGFGQAVLGVDGLYGGRRRRVWETSPSFRDHVLSVSELYVRLIEAERQGQVELLDFDGEPSCWRSFFGDGGSRTLKPDAYARLGIGEYERNSFIEVDQGTESCPTVQRRCGMYIAYWQSGQEQRRHGVFPSVVWLVPNERRRECLAAVIGRLPAEMRPLFAVATQSDGPTLLTATPDGGGHGEAL